MNNLSFSGISFIKKYGDNNSGNLLFNSENLFILRQLLPSFKGKIKLIYIDPPYNTGHSFIHYEDNFDHDEWIAMMEERLQILRDFLLDNGSIWISIDDGGVHYLKVLCDKIFGRKNFVSNIVWEKRSSPSNDCRHISNNHDSILVYAKNISRWKANLLPRTDKIKERYKNPDNDPRGVWMSSDLTVKTPSDEYKYSIITPSGRKVFPSEGRSWSMPKNNFEKLLKDNRIWFGENNSNMPRLKRFLSDVKEGIVPKSLWQRAEVGDNQESKKEAKQINGVNIFTTPKPERLLQRIIHIASNEKDWVLDAFAGSGTTGAVAHKMNRRWIMIEINGVCESHCLPRMIKVINGNDNIGISQKLKWRGGGGFKYYKSQNNHK